MKNPFEWFHSLYYGERLSLQDFDTKNPASLDALLKQIFMTGHKGTIKKKMLNAPIGNKCLSNGWFMQY